MAFNERSVDTQNWTERNLSTDSWTERSDLDLCYFVKNGETTTDQTAPTLSNFYAIDIGTDYAIFDWETDEEANCRVDYSTAFPFVDGEVVTGSTHEHYIFDNRSYLITGLKSDTTYYVIAYSVDRYGNLGSSGAYQFKTASNTKPGNPPSPYSG